MKTTFDIQNGFLEIWPIDRHNSEVQIRIVISDYQASLNGKQLELFAVNILKAIKSKKLKTNE